MSERPVKNCVWCAIEIDLHALVCHRCRNWQSWRHLLRSFLPARAAWADAVTGTHGYAADIRKDGRGRR